MAAINSGQVMAWPVSPRTCAAASRALRCFPGGSTASGAGAGSGAARGALGAFFTFTGGAGGLSFAFAAGDGVAFFALMVRLRVQGPDGVAAIVRPGPPRPGDAGTTPRVSAAAAPGAA